MLTARASLRLAPFQKSVNTMQAGKIRTLLRVSGSAESSNRLRKVRQLIKFPNIPHCVHFHPAPFTRPSFSIFRGSGCETNGSVA